MSYGQPLVTTLPTPGVTQSPTFEALLIAREQELEAILETKVTENDIAITVGDFKTHAARPTELHASGFALVGATYDAANLYASAAGAGNTATHELVVQPGQRITKVRIHGRNSGVAWTAAVLKIAKGTGVVNQIGTVNSGAVAGTIEPKDIILTETVLDDVAYVVRWTAGGAGDRLIGGRFEVDRP